MTRWRWIGILSLALWSGRWMAPVANAGSTGYSVEDLKLHSAGDLVDVCTIASGHEEYATALAFCYGFFEGAIRYSEAISASKHHKKLVCAPTGTTRLQAVEAFVSFIKTNPQYADEGPVDAMYRALMPLWPCPE
ncbi:MAG TPA: Rap1a/Tai family immunity protein [Halioglobus sp.]